MKQVTIRKVVETANGPIIGCVTDGICSFKGIPYAAPPVGKRRWKPPEPPENRHKPLEAFFFGAVCPQDETLGPAPGPMNEDCLTLNIWSPEKDHGAPFPVMVWIHGGGFSTGAGSVPIYSGHALARKDAVIVTINYRLNVFGFLAHPDLSAETGRHHSGNYGLMDQILALQWVQSNIRAFGGDPDQVTLFGESAGGASVAALLSSKQAVGLFHRAIVQSGGYAPFLLRKLDEPNGTLAGAQTLGQQFARALGFSDHQGVIEKMRQIPAKALAGAWFQTIANDISDTGIAGSWMTNHLIIDGHVLTDSPGETFRRGLQHNIPFLCGTNLDEGTFFQYIVLSDRPDMKRYQNYMERVFGKAKDDVLDYFSAKNAEDAAQAVCRVWESGFLCGARRLCRFMSLVQPQTFRYLFAWPPKFFLYALLGIPDWQKRFGCYHAAELPYVFKFLSLPDMAEEDRLFADRISDYWVRFARTGDPNGQDALIWPPYGLPEEKYLIFANPPNTGRGLKNEWCDFMDTLEEKIL